MQWVVLRRLGRAKERLTVDLLLLSAIVCGCQECPKIQDDNSLYV